VLRLNLSSNKIKAINDLFCKSFVNLRELDLRSNKVSEVSRNIRCLNQLRSLRLDRNYVVNLPDEIYQLSNLEVLGLA